MYASDFCMCENNTKMKKEAEFLPDSRAFFPNFLLCGSGIRIQLGFGSKTLKTTPSAPPPPSCTAM